MESLKSDLESGNIFLGIEFGSTRIKAVVINEKMEPVLSAYSEWENTLKDGIWTYSLSEAVEKLRETYRKLREKALQEMNVNLTEFRSIGISGMMHGYIALDNRGRALSEFRTWRNTNAQEAAEILSKEFQFNVPCRWSVAQLYQSMLDQEAHVENISYLTTLAGYIHYLLTDQKVLGICDSSGMFPVSSLTGDYDATMIKKFNELAEKQGYKKRIKNILPKVCKAGEAGGILTEVGAQLLDPTGNLKSGIPMAPPEGDAGTGMISTNAIRKKTGNISVGTSIFSMMILEKPLKKFYRDVDVLLSPAGNDVAMIHCNNCTSELNMWVNVFREVIDLFEGTCTDESLYKKLIECVSDSDSQFGNVYSYGFVSSEPIVGVHKGCPSVKRSEKNLFTLSNLMGSLMAGAFIPLKFGMTFLEEQEGIRQDFFMAHGGLLKSQAITGPLMADIFNCRIGVMQNSGEGGAYGMALLAAFSDWHLRENQLLTEFLDEKVFAQENIAVYEPNQNRVQNLEEYINHYKLKI